MTDAEIVDNAILQLLLPERNAMDPARELSVDAYNIEPMQEGDIRLAPAGSSMVTGWSNVADAIKHTITGRMHIDFIDRTSNYSDEVVMKLQRVVPQSEAYYHVAPWFMDWYTNSSLIDPTIQPLVSELNNIARASMNHMIFRGEDKLYEKVCSTLSRRWETTNPQVLAELKVASSRTSQAISSGTSDESSVQSTFQHLGGQSNLIDFTLMLWIALYFSACQSEGETGRIWGLTNRRRDHLEITRPDTMIEDIAKRRQEMQMAYFVESPSGYIPEKDLIEIARIPTAEKAPILEMLSRIGITREVLFPDVVDFLKHGQDRITLEGLLHLFVEWLRNDEYGRVISATDGIIAKSDRSDFKFEACLYLRGLARALNGDPHRGYQDLLEFKKAVGEDRGSTPILASNLYALLLASRSGNISRLKSRLDLTVWKGLYSLTLGGYRVRDIAEANVEDREQ